ncbi:hypothetical protein D9757_009429 [Collybiopsis confluens]|uniref:DNA-(apurinic or apyrimidinic site) endonuclease 2 n=1 Tax=Collybiopsis confluens TaxID=2823264 RepID=A0A8H5HCU0_9AGAR|nr:hypothetical protein D9757_009429 [Collybiopsis confluens]
MRILTWNINGIRTIPQYHPWNTLKTHDAILNHLQADIINFQEVKSTRTTLPATVALPPSFDAYYSFPLSKNGYSGVATYTRKPSADSPGVTALKAEEGLTGQLRQPHLKPPLSDEERVSRPEAYEYEEFEVDSVDLKALDAEGRVLTLDFGLFVLINVYCPNDGSTEEDNSRFEYKMAFHRLLEARVRSLIGEGRQVVLLGDINACVGVIDHCEGDIIMRRGVAQGFSGDNEEYFWVENGARRWLKDLLEGENKCLVDIVRKYHPDRQGMFTCEQNNPLCLYISHLSQGWNTKISARASNYGTRIDYILVTPGLLPWIKAADIEPSVKGSDHCPVWIELHEQISIPSPDGIEKTVILRDVMLNPTKTTDPPRLATRFWDEYSGKQRSLASFFGKQSLEKKPKAGETSTTGKSSSLDQSSMAARNAEEAVSTPSAPELGASPTPPILTPPQSQSSIPSTPTENSNAATMTTSKKRKFPPPASASSSPFSQTTQPKAKKFKQGKGAKEVKKAGQAKLSSFFTTPSSSAVKGKGRKGEHSDSTVDLTMSDGEDDTMADAVEDPIGPETGDDEDLKQAIQLSLTSSSSQNSSSPIATCSSSSQEAWKSLLKPPEPPRCVVHNEGAKQFRVNKPGVNKGRSFWVCSRPVGPGYDKGRSERPREEVDERWKCNFFVWSSDLGANRKGSRTVK